MLKFGIIFIYKEKTNTTHYSQIACYDFQHSLF